MRLVLSAILAVAAGCQRFEPPPAAAWPLVGAVPPLASNLDEGCLEDYQPGADYFPDKTDFAHSAQLRIAYHGHYKTVEFTPAVDNKEVLRYALVQCGASPPTDFPPGRRIEIPIRRFTTAHHSMLSAVVLLGIEDRLAGVTNRFTITEPTIRRLALDRELPEVGAGTHANIELTMAVAPDVHFTFYSAYPEFNLHPKLWEAGVRAFPMADHMERTPLGRAEWVKLLAALTNRERRANEWFGEVEPEYQQLRALTRGVSERPTVLSGRSSTRDAWELRGGENNFAALVHDAGGKYFWERGGASSWEHGSFEAILHRSADSIVWIGGPERLDTIGQMLAQDARLAWFRPVRMRRVHALDRGGIDAWASPWADQSMDKPHRALADLIRAIHPEIAIEHPEMFARQLD